MAQEKRDFGAMSDEELVGEVQSMRADYLRSQFQHTITGLMNPMDLRTMRRDIARGLTEVRRRELERMSPEELANRSKIRARRRRR